MSARAAFALSKYSGLCSRTFTRCRGQNMIIRSNHLASDPEQQDMRRRLDGIQEEDPKPKHCNPLFPHRSTWENILPKIPQRQEDLLKDLELRQITCLACKDDDDLKKKCAEMAEKKKCKELAEKEKCKKKAGGGGKKGGGKGGKGGKCGKGGEEEQKKKCAEMEQKKKCAAMAKKEKEAAEKKKCKELAKKEKEAAEKKKCKEMAEKEKCKKLAEKDKCKDK
ncbi:hypothetical protein KR009_008837 [Drosophila setifemur]|nr:hypothetical protein KR009_008837 [Drosophila setifemur]